MAEPRILVVGAGLAGVLLAWRLQQAGARPTIIGTAGTGPPDATTSSGGLCRSFEPGPAARALATASLTELLADPALARDAGWHRTGSLYVVPADPGDTAGIRVTSVEIRRRFGMTGLPESAVGVWEPRAGHLSPDRLRRTVLRGLTTTEPAPVARLGGDGSVVLADGRRLTGDLVVVAAGPWTPGLLRSAGLPTTLRTKHIQYARYAVTGAVPPCFVDETSGLYGRPDGPGHVLLGLPSDRWDVDPATVARPDTALAARVLAVAAHRLPGLGPRPAGPPVSAADCYSEPAGLALRPVTARLHTFTGGSGGAAKVALAASRVAARSLLHRPAVPESPYTEASR